MPNSYYTPTGNPGDYSPGTSALIRSEFSLVEAAFNALPAVSGAANRLVVVNAAGTALTTVFSGVYGGGTNTSNAAYGLNALTANFGGYNSAFGAGALAATASSSNNSAFGYAAMTANTGNNNCAFGVSSLAANTASSNCAFGYAALQLNTTGPVNTAIGSNALQANLSGTGNVAVGATALAASLGQANVGVGWLAGQSLVSGNNNTLVGASTDVIAAASGCTALGFGAACTASNQMVLGNASVTLIRGMADNLTDLGSASFRLKSAYFGTSLVGNLGAVSSLAALDLMCTGSAGVGIKLTGDGATTPSKYIRVIGGVLEVVNSNYTLAITRFSDTGSLSALNASAIPAGGTTGEGVKVSTTANFGVFFGSGVPTLSAAQGSLYLRSDGSATNNRAYINTNGATTWTALTTAA